MVKRKYPPINLSKKESEEIVKRFEKSGIPMKGGKPKRIVFHKDFELGARLSVCKICGYPLEFWGAPDGLLPCEGCDNHNPKKLPKIFPLVDFEKYIKYIQKRIIHQNKKRRE